MLKYLDLGNDISLNIYRFTISQIYANSQYAFIYREAGISNFRSLIGKGRKHK